MKKVLLLLAIALTMASCASFTTSSFVVNDTDYNPYKTFGFLPLDLSKVPTAVSPANVELLKRAIIDQMKARGFKYVSENASMSFNLGLIMEKETSVSSSGHYVSPSYYWAPAAYRWGRYPMARGAYTSDVNVNTYDIGTLIIDLVDVNAKQVLWHGAVSGTVDKNSKMAPENTQAAIEKLFREFPVASAATVETTL